jgi:cation transport regulator
MPYATNDHLPPPVRGHLPAHAQSIFREAFNRAYERHPGDETIAFRVAWSAVKRRYEKVDGEWVPFSSAWQGTSPARFLAAIRWIIG